MDEQAARVIFAKTLQDTLVEVFDAHGIDTLYEDELTSIVHECTRRCYPQCLAELKIMQGISPFS